MVLTWKGGREQPCVAVENLGLCVISEKASDF
jgi:hypothetical protein